MRSSFIHASLKLAEDALSTRNASSTQPTTSKNENAAVVVTTGLKAKKRKRVADIGDESQNMDIDPPHAAIVDGDEAGADDLKTKPKKAKKAKGNSKISIACEYCRGRKIKCGGEKPKCTRCQEDGRHCVYSDTVRRRGPGKATLARLALQTPASPQPASPFPIEKSQCNSPSPIPVSEDVPPAPHPTPATPAVPPAPPTSPATSATSPAISVTSPAVSETVATNATFNNSLPITAIPETIADEKASLASSADTHVAESPPNIAEPTGVVMIDDFVTPIETVTPEQVSPTTTDHPLPTQYFVQGVPVDLFPAGVANHILAPAESGAAYSSASDGMSTDEEMEVDSELDASQMSWLSLIAPEVTKEATTPIITQETDVGRSDALDHMYLGGYTPSDNIINRSDCTSPLFTDGNFGFMDEDELFTRYRNEINALFGGGMTMEM